MLVSLTKEQVEYLAKIFEEVDEENNLSDLELDILVALTDALEDYNPYHEI